MTQIDVPDEPRPRSRGSAARLTVIEVVVAVGVLAVLAAIAIPSYLSLQGNAVVTARATVAANAATQVVISLRDEPTVPLTAASFAALADGGRYSFAITDGGDISRFCITVSERDVPSSENRTAGPGCATPSG